MSYEDEVRRRSVGRFMALILMSLCSLASCSGESIQLERWEVLSRASDDYFAPYFKGRSMSDADGERTGISPIDGDLAYLPGKPGSWLAHYQEIERLDGEGELLKTISRRADDRWIRTVGHFDVSANGALVVLDEDHSLMGRFGDPAALSTYDENGEPLKVFLLPFGMETYRVAMNSDWILVVGFDSVFHLFDRDDGSGQRVSLANLIEDGNNCRYDFGNQDTELWVVESGTRTRLHRFALPDR